MQKNHQADKQFLQEVGALLAARAGQGHMAPPPSLSHLAEYIASARRYQKLTRAALALKMGISEAEIYALEQGLLSYTELDLHFLGKLAVALDEDLETLLLLLGRPALVQALQRPAARRTEEQAQCLAYPPYPKEKATAPKPHGNRLSRRPWANALYKGCLNLIDSWRQGRLSSYIRVNYQLQPMAAILLCLFLIGVSTYSIAGRFGAQSAIQSGLTISARPDGLPPTQLRRGMDQPTVRSFQRLYPPIEATMNPVTASVNAPAPTVAFAAHHITAETQQCVVLTLGRPALCRV
ncbi:MAG: XRE family transcriptional regulator [Caldilinea sp. CFX5]|nr:XRE family transcriptional regulator [Caldilinea sp. CFX5]